MGRPRPRFVADPQEAISAVELDGLAVIFHARSGMTHIVAPPAPQILAALRLGPAEAGEVLARIRSAHDLEVDGVGEGTETEAIAARLEELETAGLVRRL